MRSCVLIIVPSAVDWLGHQKRLDLLEIIGEDDALALVVRLGLNKPHIFLAMLLRHFFLMIIFLLDLVELLHKIFIFRIIPMRPYS